MVGEPSAFIKVKKQLQCTLPDKIEIKMMGGTMSTNSTLIAISDDNGKTWSKIGPINDGKLGKFVSYKIVTDIIKK
jgi:Neuraminidase (sialidase)